MLPDRQAVIDIVSQRGSLLKDMGPAIRNAEDIVLAAVGEDGLAVQYASDRLRGSREVMHKAISRAASACRYAKWPLKPNDPALLEFAGVLNRYDFCDSCLLPEIVMSVRFGFTDKASWISTAMYLRLGDHFTSEGQSGALLGRHRIYYPSLANKGFCGATCCKKSLITSTRWPCRGTCRQINVRWPCCRRRGKVIWFNLYVGWLHHILYQGSPDDETCWRSSFRFHQLKARRTGGFMVLIVEREQGGEFQLGPGQRIEREMAKILGLKVFIVNVPDEAHVDIAANNLIAAIQAWNDRGRDQEEEEVMV